MKCAYCCALPAAGQSFGLSLGYTACSSCAQLQDDIDGYLTDQYLDAFEDVSTSGAAVN